MDFVYLILIYLVIDGVICEENKFRKNPLLDRRKRYVAFPKGSTFVINLTITKPLLANITNPVTNFLGECDVPFPLPTKEDVLKAKLSKKKPLHYRQRRDLYFHLEDALKAMGLNGNSCVKRLLCEAKNSLPPTGKSVVADLLSSIFDFYDVDKYNDHDHKNFCDPKVFENCDISILGLLYYSLNVAKQTEESENGL
ncbi:uncharacterized protein LOC108735658 [Agrilus planipennis]|uniref:Uncharacterized protein LOC108735658 n=1 Tax=Agrilus planipennis TaxID=224129 RepID=A0A1W4WH08_AGRPL|nr:uncharacterized protein LOC108735658 [Agrilus planipennis]